MRTPSPPFLPPPFSKQKLPDFSFMTSLLDSHTTTDDKLDNLSDVKTGNGIPYDTYNVPGIAHARTNRKDDIFMQRRLVQNSTFILKWGQGT